MQGQNEAAEIVNQYGQIKALSEMGVTFRPHDFSISQMECFLIVEGELRELKKQEGKRMRSKYGK